MPIHGTRLNEKLVLGLLSGRANTLIDASHCQGVDRLRYAIAMPIVLVMIRTARTLVSDIPQPLGVVGPAAPCVPFPVRRFIL